MTEGDIKWPADKVDRRAVADLVPYARNARTHSDEQVEQIAESIKEWGWTVPILVDEGGGIIAGHGRVMAAQEDLLTPKRAIVERLALARTEFHFNYPDAMREGPVLTAENGNRGCQRKLG